MTMMERADPVTGFRFAVEIGEQVQGWFTECSGLTVERKVHPQPEGGVNNYVHQLPGRIEQSRVTLKHGLAGNELWNWFQEGLYDGKVVRRNVSIKLYSTDRTKVKEWILDKAYPVKWTGPSLNSTGNEVAIETLELIHHGLQMKDWA